MGILSVEKLYDIRYDGNVKIVGIPYTRRVYLKCIVVSLNNELLYTNDVTNIRINLLCRYTCAV